MDFILLVQDMWNSTIQGHVGVSLIFGYMGFIVAIALWRIAQGCKKGGH